MAAEQFCTVSKAVYSTCARLSPIIHVKREASMELIDLFSVDCMLAEEQRLGVKKKAWCHLFM